jgi:hypothetical protein
LVIQLGKFEGRFFLLSLSSNDISPAKEKSKKYNFGEIHFVKYASRLPAVAGNIPHFVWLNTLHKFLVEKRVLKCQSAVVDTKYISPTRGRQASMSEEER